MARLIDGRPRPFERVLSRIEGGVFRLAGVSKDKSMSWKEYLLALLLTNTFVSVFVFAVLMAQGFLPLNPSRFPGLTPDLAFHTATSFITNTDLQHYSGEAKLSMLSQLALLVPMFVAPGSAFAAAFAFIRPFLRKGAGVGNFYVDLIRVILTILIPVSFVSAIILLGFGVPQTLNATITTRGFESQQTIPIGPLAAWEAIKEFGNNGGGFLGANSAHPFENPNGITNTFEIILMLSGPLAFPIAYGKVLGRGRGWALFIAIVVPFLALTAFALLSNSGPTGLETRFGSFGSVLFQTSSISSNTGATNALLAGISRKGIISLFVFMFVQAIPGGEGAGFMTMIIYVILTLFIVGLMVGKTPEFIGMKIAPWEVMLSVIIFIIHPVMILIPSVVAFATGQAQAILGNQVTPFTYTQVLYEFTSASANNGSDYLGAAADTPFWNLSTGIVMVVGRYAPISLMLAIAGAFAMKDRRLAPEPIKTDSLPFIVTLIAVAFLLTAIAFLPFLVIGPFIR